MDGAAAPLHDALALVELDSIARGYKVVDALVKKAPVHLLEVNLVEPGKCLILFAGDVESVNEAFSCALEVAEEHCLDAMNLSKVHEALIPALAGAVDCSDPNTLGVVEGAVVGATLLACDQALKNSSVTLAGLRVTPGLGGKAYFVLHGDHADVESGLATAEEVLAAGEHLIRVECIPAPHPDFVASILRPAPFSLEQR
ncbi:MAG: BMC domain-containing protein [Myxococcota bacterium]|nr:BMC domain-containing protein [Myxococcota bacterium]